MFFDVKNPKIRSLFHEQFFIMLGVAMYAVAWNMFIKPHHIVGGGLGGISAMVEYITGINMSVTYGVVNVVLCVIAYLIMGRDFSAKTVIGIVYVTALLALVPTPEVPLILDPLLSCIMAGIISGAGIASYLMQGASTGGSDIVVMIVSKYKNVSWGRIYVLFDACVISMSCFMPEGNLQKVAYGFVFMGVASYTVDLVHNGMRQSVQMFIFTSKYNEICNQIIHKHHRGATLFESIGWYTKQHRKTIYLVAKKRESQAIFQTVKAIDEHAFIAVSNVMSVFGMGFDAIKSGFRKAQITDENGNPIEFDPATGQPIAHAITSEMLIEQGRIERANAIMPEKNAPNGGVVREVTVDSEILTDEIMARASEAQNSAPVFNPNWTTPISEIMEVPEMPIVPQGAEASIRHSLSTDGMPPVPASWPEHADERRHF